MDRKLARAELDYAKKSIAFKAALKAAERAAHQTSDHLLAMADLLVAREDEEAARIRVMRLLRGRKSR